MEVSGSFSLVLVNPTPEKQFANLGQAAAFLLSDLQKGGFDLTGDSKTNPFVFGCHKLAGIVERIFAPRRRARQHTLCLEWKTSSACSPAEPDGIAALIRTRCVIPG